MEALPLNAVLVVSSVVFCIGAIGVMLRRSTIVVFMCIELMLNAVNVVFATFSKMHGNLDGQIAVFFVMVVAAAEAAVGLAIILSVFRAIQSTETTDSAELKL